MSQNRFGEDSGSASSPAAYRRPREERRLAHKWKLQAATEPPKSRRLVFWILLYILGFTMCWIEACWSSHFFLRVLWLPLVLISTFRSKLWGSCLYSFVLSGMWCALHLSFSGGSSVPGPLPMSVTLWEAGARMVASLFIVGILQFYRIQIQHYQHLQRIDALTGLSNAQALYERVEIELHRCNRTNKSLTIALLDCDSFKRINDTYGHQCGDAALQDVSSALRDQIRAYDLIARLGGDEFVVILPEADSATAHTIIDRLRSVLSHGKENEKWKITMCWGVVTYIPPIELTASELIDIADQQMYAAKRRGNDNVCYHDVVAEKSSKQATS